MKSEETIYDRDEATRYDMPAGEQENEKTVHTASDKQPQGAPQKGEWKKVVLGGVTGLVLGGVAATLTSGTPAAEAGPDQPEEPAHDDPAPVQPVADQGVSMATGVNDEMSFSEAFATARHEVGSGGAFMWRGNAYSTYYAEEWDNMTAEQRAEYNEHFSWSSQQGREEHLADNTSQTTEEVDAVVVEQPQQQNGQEQGHEDLAQTDEGGAVEAQTVDNGDVAVDGMPDPEIEIVGVEYNEELGINVGMMTVNGEEMAFVDIDNDGTFEVAVVDANHDGRISEDEMVDISGQGVTVEQFGGLQDPNEGMLASNDEPDYVNDANVYEA